MPYLDDPIRLLVVLDHFGTPSSSTKEPMLMEENARCLDLLIGQPGALICTTLEMLSPTSDHGSLASEIRSLYRERPTEGHSLTSHPVFWDDTIARLSCRNLIRILPHEEGLQLVLTPDGMSFLRSRPESNLIRSRQRCRFISKWLGEHPTSARFSESMTTADRRLDEFMAMHELTTGDDIVNQRFFAAFGRPL